MNELLPKPGMCIYIVIWFGIANGQILSIFDRVICLPHDSGGVLSFTFSLNVADMFIFFSPGILCNGRKLLQKQR